MKEKCKERVFGEYHFRQCSRKPWKDGYCKQHHPDTIEKRKKEQDQRWEEKRKKDPIEVAYKKIKELEAQIEKMKKAIDIRDRIME